MAKPRVKPNDERQLTMEVVEENHIRIDPHNKTRRSIGRFGRSGGNGLGDRTVDSPLTRPSVRAFAAGCAGRRSSRKGGWNWESRVAVQWSMREKMGQGVVVGLSVAIAMAGVVLLGGAAEASCLPTDVERDLETSDLVFVGSVEELTNEDRWATFRVEEIWKGNPGSSAVEVRGGPGAPAATSNDRTYAAGERYLVFASDVSRRPGVGVQFGEGARWVDGACSATRPYESSLDRFRPPGAGPVSSSETASGISLETAVIVAAVMILATGAVAAVVLRRRQAPG